MVRKIQENIPDEILHQDLEKYRRRALELGASDALPSSLKTYPFISAPQ